MSENELVKHLDLVNKVAEEYLKGLDTAEISKELDIPRQRLQVFLSDWRADGSK
jgi:orotate phosphoribosyltransferase-like protein